MRETSSKEHKIRDNLKKYLTTSSTTKAHLKANDSNRVT